jgi:hypothetical protein
MGACDDGLPGRASSPKLAFRESPRIQNMASERTPTQGCPENEENALFPTTFDRQTDIIANAD